MSRRGLQRWLGKLQEAWPSLPWKDVVSLRHVHGSEVLIGCPIPGVVPQDEESGSRPGRKTGVLFQEFHGAWILPRHLAVHVDEAIMNGPQPWTHDLQMLLEYVFPILANHTGCSVTELADDHGIEVIATHACAVIAEHLDVDAE